MKALYWVPYMYYVKRSSPQSCELGAIFMLILQNRKSNLKGM